jgi:hypothetical protein
MSRAWPCTGTQERRSHTRSFRKHHVARRLDSEDEEMAMSTTGHRTSTAPRLKRLQQIIERRNLDGVVVSSSERLLFAGTHSMTQQNLPDRLAWLVVPPVGEPCLVVRDEFKRQGLPFSMPHFGHGMGIGLRIQA